MGRKRKFGRSLNGVLIVDKPPGESSNGVLQRAKRLFFAAKAGHTGSLDPFATGVLPLCFGEATKFSQFLLDADKEYVATFHFGVHTDTGDKDGKILSQHDASSIVVKKLEDVIGNYRGNILQVPPMYSALKRNGRPLYELAREGIEVEREARPVSVYEFSVLAFRPGAIAELDCRIRCSKGTYIRSLAENIGQDLGVGAHVAALRRTQAGPFTETQSHSLEALFERRGEGRAEVLDDCLLPVDAAVSTLAKLEILDNSAYYFMRGQAVMEAGIAKSGEEGDLLRVFEESGKFLGLGEVTDEGTVAPRRLVAN